MLPNTYTPSVDDVFDIDAIIRAIEATEIDPDDENDVWIIGD